MNDVERLLQTDRAADLPDLPDMRYTEAAVRRRLGRAPDPAPPGERFPWEMVVVALALMVSLAAALLWLGVSLWWLGALPVSLLPMVPILLAKEHEGS